MASGLFNITNVINNGGSPTSYTLTTSGTSGIALNDHIGAKNTGGEGAIYSVSSIIGPTTIIVEDLLTEARDSEFGDPQVGLASFETPEPNYHITQLPFGSPGWDAAIRRNNYITDNIANLDVPTGNNGILRLRNFTVSQANALTDLAIGSLIFVINETGGATVAFYDGSDWRRVQDRTIIS